MNTRSTLSSEALLSYEEAIGKLLADVPKPRSTCVPLSEALGRILASPVATDSDLPAFNRSFVDGFAVRSQDVTRAPVKLRIAGVVAAGDSSQSHIRDGQAVQIMTGAPIPPGADAVQMVEKTHRASKLEVELLESVTPGENLEIKGSQARAGEAVLARGRLVGAAEIGVLAICGQAEVEVYAIPRVALIPTGDELVEVEQRPKLGQIRNSNAYALWAQCQRLGLDAAVFPPVPDDPEQIRENIREALKYDLAIFTGGVSMGERDYVPRLMAEAGVVNFFHKVAIKPGKPILAGKKGDHMVFGLPGNPVSAFVTFELFVRPVVRSWSGFAQPSLPRISGELVADVKQKPGRKFFKQAITAWDNGRFKINPIETQGSGDLAGFSVANSLLILEPEVAHLRAGQQVEALLLENGSNENNE